MSPDDARYCAWFHELDAWTEYWDVYHPETNGRFYFGDGHSEPGLLTRFLPRDGRPPPFVAWTRLALSPASSAAAAQREFAQQVRAPHVSEGVMEVDHLVGTLFRKHFGDAKDPNVQSDYLEATFRFGIDSLPPAIERDARIADDDPRKSTAGRHTLDGDLMWFAWALHLEAGHLIAGHDVDHQRRALQLAAIAMGCPANFAWRGHRRTRPEYHADPETAGLLRQRAMAWINDFDAAAAEIHALFRIREWGSAD